MSNTITNKKKCKQKTKASINNDDNTGCLVFQKLVLSFKMKVQKIKNNKKFLTLKIR